MNDRFKFRVWNKNTHSFTTGGAIKDGGLCFAYVVGEEELEIKLGEDQENYIIEQCTGLKDKNGNLIYENDRVGFYVYGQDEEWHAQQGTVIWYNSCWGIETSSRFIQFENELTIKNPRDIEIIGNIHEQPEQKEVK